MAVKRSATDIATNDLFEFRFYSVSWRLDDPSSCRFLQFEVRQASASVSLLWFLPFLLGLSTLDSRSADRVGDFCSRPSNLLLAMLPEQIPASAVSNVTGFLCPFLFSLERSRSDGPPAASGCGGLCETAGRVHRLVWIGLDGLALHGRGRNVKPSASRCSFEW